MKKAVRAIAVVLVFFAVISLCPVERASAGEFIGSWWDAYLRVNSPLYEFLTKKYRETEITDPKELYQMYVDDLMTTYGTSTFGENGYYIYPQFRSVNLSSNYWVSGSEYEMSGNVMRLSAVRSQHYDKGNVGLDYYTLLAPVTGHYTFIYNITSSHDVEYEVANTAYWVNCVERTAFTAGSAIIQQSTNTNSRGGWLFVYSSPGEYATLAMVVAVLVEPASYEPINTPADTRPGGYNLDYSYYSSVDSSQLVNISNYKMIDESSSTVYNPITETATTYENWTYDYSTRTYTFTTTDASTTVTYGDENVTIREGDITYNIYYTIASEAPDPEPSPTTDPSVCSHNYSETVITAPTCTSAGQRRLTCAKCGDVKTENVSALGHSWQLDRTVNTVYDEDGEKIQDGYSIYVCALCGEQYKDDSGTGPPSGTSGGGGGLLSEIFEKLGKLLGGIAEGALTLITAAVSKILDGIIALVDMMSEKLAQFVEVTLSIFEQIPAMFGGFVEFLKEAFAFLPPDVVVILGFGALLMVLIGIIKLIFGR